MKRLLFALILSTGSILFAREFFVSPQGSDKNDGSKTAPWRSLDKVNFSLKAGDTATFLPGRYEGAITPGNSGEDGKAIVYRSQEPGRAVILGGSGNDGKDDQRGAVFIVGRNHIELDGFSFAVPLNFCWMRITDASHIKVRNCVFDGGGVYSPINCRNVRYSRFENLSFTRGLYTHRGFVRCDMWNNYNSSYNIYDGFYISRFGHRPLGFAPDCPYNVVRNSVFDCRWGRNFEFFSTPYILMEKCVVTNSYDGSNSADGRSKIFFQNSIFRRNVMFRNWSAPLVFNSYKDSYQNNMIHVLKGNRFYNNTFFRNSDAGIELYEYWGKDADYPTLADNKFVNNIFSENNTGGDKIAFLLEGGKAINESNTFYNNLLSESPDDAVCKFSHPERQSLTLAETEKRYPKQFFDNFTFAPGFIDAERDDFQLKPGSRAIDAGAMLAFAVEPSKGNVIKVTDAAFFYDGFNIPGEKGDELMIGPSKQIAVVTGRDLEKNLLTLDREVSAVKGDAVTLSYAGKAPDLGAYETGGKDNPLPFRSGLRMPTMADSDEVSIFTDFEPENQENWFYLWSFTRQKNSDAEIDLAGGAGGSKGCLKVFATGDKSVLAVYIAPPQWDIDRYPIVSFDYRIPAGVPVGLMYSPYPRKGLKDLNIYLGGSPGYQSGNAPDLRLCNLVADGEWHRFRLDLSVLKKHDPQLKFLKRFRFYTNENGKKGDFYQLDNFRIERK